MSVSHPASSQRPSGKESRDYCTEGRREDERDMGHLGSAFPHRLLGLFLPIPILRKQEFYDFHGNHQPGPFKTNSTFISQVRDNWVLFAHSHTQSGPLPQLPHRISSSTELWSGFTTITPALKLSWPGFHTISSCQRNGCSRWGSLSSSTCECRQTYQSPLLCCERIFIADTMCIFFITFLQSFYVLILLSNHIIFQRIGKSSNLLSLINEKNTLKHWFFVLTKNIKCTICCGSVGQTSHLVFCSICPWEWELLCVALEMVTYCFQLY